MDDIRLKYLNHPLYSFEYPEVYVLSDLNLPPPTDQGGIPMRLQFGVSEANFHYDSDVVKSSFGIRVEKPGLYSTNASDKFSQYVSEANDMGKNVTITKLVLSGITADYVEYNRLSLDILDGAEITDTHSSLRAITFDYSGLIWIIVMYCTYSGSEPPEIQDYFTHIVETFKILDASIPSGK